MGRGPIHEISFPIIAVRNGVTILKAEILSIAFYTNLNITFEFEQFLSITAR
jgi:hypothetical protein